MITDNINDPVLTALKKWLNDPNNVGEYIKKHEKLSMIQNRWLEKFHSITQEERLSIVEKMINKYESDDYRDREWFKCKCEPRTPLYFLLYYYGMKYGKEYDEDLNGYFPEEKVIIDDCIIVSLIHGQGTIATVTIKKDKI